MFSDEYSQGLCFINLKGYLILIDICTVPKQLHNYDEIEKSIIKLKCKKAAGIDGIPAEFYKNGCNEFLPALVLLFNTIIGNKEYPSSWATGIIHPVHKKAAHNVPNIYRKVTVMPCIGKLFESVLTRLSFKNDVYTDNDPFQGGFNSNSRTTDNILIVCAIIDK